MIGIKAVQIYDIADTISASNNKPVEHQEDRRKLKLSTLVNILKSNGINVVKSNDCDTAFDSTRNAFIIGGDDLITKIRLGIEAWITVSLNNDNIQISESWHSMLVRYAIYSILTYFKIKSKESLDGIDSIYNEDSDDIWSFIELLDYVEDIINNQLLCIDTDSGEYISSEHKNYIAKRAEMLLNILEANYNAVQISGD